MMFRSHFWLAVRTVLLSILLFSIGVPGAYCKKITLFLKYGHSYFPCEAMLINNGKGVVARVVLEDGKKMAIQFLSREIAEVKTAVDISWMELPEGGLEAVNQESIASIVRLKHTEQSATYKIDRGRGALGCEELAEQSVVPDGILEKNLPLMVTREAGQQTLVVDMGSSMAHMIRISEREQAMKAGVSEVTQLLDNLSVLPSKKSPSLVIVILV